MAYEVYRIEHFEKVEVCIANANAKANEVCNGGKRSFGLHKTGRRYRSY